MHTVIRSILVSALILLVPLCAIAQDYYYDLDSVYWVNPSNTTIAVQFDTTRPVPHIATFVVRHACLNASIEVEPIERGFYLFALQSTCTYATAAAALATDEDVYRVTPSYITDLDGAAFQVTDLVSVQFNEDLPIAAALAILDSNSLYFVDSCQYRHNLWWCALDDSIRESPLPYGNTLHLLPETEWASATMYDRPVAMSEPTDPYYSNQYYLKNTGQNGGTVDVDIDAELAWEVALAKSGVRVAVLDDGVAPHPDLTSPRLMTGWDFVGSNWQTPVWDDNPAPGESGNHGMACAGILASAHNGVGIAGVSPGSEVIPIKIADDEGGYPDISRHIVNGIYLAYAMGAKVISNSWGYNRGETALTDIAHAIRYVTDPCGRPGGPAGQEGVIMVFSAGNGANDVPPFPHVAFPANMPEVIAVGAVDNKSERQSYSPIGPTLDLMAPSGLCQDPVTGEFLGDVWTVDQEADLGWNPWVTGLDDASGDHDYTAKMGGTSAAAPQVAGIAAMLLARRPDLQSGCQPSDAILRILAGSAIDLGTEGFDYETGYGRANAYRALLSVIHGDASNDGAVDAVDLSIVVDMIFVGGHATLDDRTGDWNCDGFVDSIDLSLIIDEIFFGGLPAPICFEY